MINTNNKFILPLKVNHWICREKCPYTVSCDNNIKYYIILVLKRLSEGRREEDEGNLQMQHHQQRQPIRAAMNIPEVILREIFSYLSISVYREIILL